MVREVTARVATATLAMLLIGTLATVGRAAPVRPATSGIQTAPSPAARSLGTVKAIQGNTITLTPDSGSEVSVLVQNSTRMVRIEPGQKDLKNATPVQLQDLQVGDRVLVRGTSSADSKSLTASSVILMKKGDIQQKQQAEEQEWRRNGLGGLVKTVDAASGTITISTGAGATAKTIAIHTSKDTVLRRYASNSVKFSDAKPGALDQIKPGDQARALGTRSADDNDLTAKEVVSGSFRNIAGTVVSVDASANEIVVNDVLTKAPVSVKVTADSQVRKLPAMMAQMIAMRVKGGSGAQPGAGAASGSGAPPAGRPEGQQPQAAAGADGRHFGGPGGGASGGTPDFQRLVNRLPQASVADLQKGDAVMIVSTEGADSAAPTAITLLSGVEPILTAAPTGSQAASFMSGWTLGGGGGGGEGGDAGPQ